MSKASRLGLGLLVVALAGCAPAGPPQSSGDRPGAPGESAAPKTLTIGQAEPTRGFAPWFIRGNPRPLQYWELHTNFLVTAGKQGTPEPRIAEKIPSVDDGTITMLADGQMRTVWKLRPNVKWHDGAPFTAADVVFGWQVMAHPDIPVQRGPTLRAMTTIEAPDPSTLVITYRIPYYLATELGYRELYPLPKHLLEDAFQADPAGFQNLPFWSSGYVHTGPFRVAEFTPGERVVFERFDQFFLGRPKVDTIVARYIGDNNTTLSNLLAGAIDIAGELPSEMAARLRDDWRASGDGFVLTEPSFWRFISIQFHPEWGGPPELQTDVRIRRGLLFGLDRDAVRAVLLPGFSDTEGDTFMAKGDPRSAVVGLPFARYPYDATRATQELTEAGWRRAADGRTLNQAGQQARLNLRTSGEYETELSLVASYWRALGIEVTQEVMPGALARDPEYIAKFPGLEITAQGVGDRILRRLDSRMHPLAENRYVGSNGGHYVNPSMDALTDRLSVTINEREQAQFLREAADIMATDLPLLPVYFHVSTVAALKHVRGLEDFPGSSQAGTTARSSHLWDRGS